MRTFCRKNKYNLKKCQEINKTYSILFRSSSLLHSSSMISSFSRFCTWIVILTLKILVMCNKKGSLSHGINLRESKHFHLQVLPILVWYIVHFIVASKVHIGHLQESPWKMFNSFKMLLIFSESSEFFKTSPQRVL